MSILLKLVYSFKAIPTKIPAALFVDIDKIILRFIWKDKGTRIANIILKKNNKMGGIGLPNFKSYYLAKRVKTVVFVGT